MPLNCRSTDYRQSTSDKFPSDTREGERWREVLVEKEKGEKRERKEVSSKQNQFVTLSAFINTSVHVDRGIEGARDQNGLI